LRSRCTTISPKRISGVTAHTHDRSGAASGGSASVAALLFPILQAAGQSIVAEPTETVQARSCARKEGMVVQAYTRAAPGASTAPRSTAARRAFQRKKPARQRLVSPIGACPGYVVDHVEPWPVADDAPENMQWQSVAEAKAKDRRERNDCAGQHTIRYSHFPRTFYALPVYGPARGHGAAGNSDSVWSWETRLPQTR